MWITLVIHIWHLIYTKTSDVYLLIIFFCDELYSRQFVTYAVFHSSKTAFFMTFFLQQAHYA